MAIHDHLGYAYLQKAVSKGHEKAREAIVNCILK